VWLAVHLPEIRTEIATRRYGGLTSFARFRPTSTASSIGRPALQKTDAVPIAHRLKSGIIKSGIIRLFLSEELDSPRT
jgi:hypothetical protein